MLYNDQSFDAPIHGQALHASKSLKLAQMQIPRDVSLLALLGFAPCIVAFARIDDPRTWWSIIVSAFVSYAGLEVTKRVIPLLKRYTLKSGLYGKDINKKGTEAGEKHIPESLGLAPGIVFLVCIILFQQLHYYDAASVLHRLWSGGSHQIFAKQPITEAWLVDYNAALATICFMLFLGFADDVLDIPWRVKLVLPCLASLPLLVAYSGGTSIVIPKPLRGLAGLPELLNLGPIYQLYMVMLTIFCTNSINILAGVNGLEAGQTFIIACAVLCHNLTELARLAPQHAAARDGHLFSAYLMLPLATTTLGLLAFNWYPSQVFVGDTFTYFAGMCVAVAGILGHQGETLLLFLIPQIFNFVYSVPQLFKFVPCPRHRLPTYDPATNLLHATPNWNLVNLMLQVFGPCTERDLCIRILGLQALSCIIAFVFRHLVTGIYK